MRDFGGGGARRQIGPLAPPSMRLEVIFLHQIDDWGVRTENGTLHGVPEGSPHVQYGGEAAGAGPVVRAPNDRAVPRRARRTAPGGASASALAGSVPLGGTGGRHDGARTPTRSVRFTETAVPVAKTGQVTPIQWQKCIKLHHRAPGVFRRQFAAAKNNPLTCAFSDWRKRRSAEGPKTAM